MMTKPKLLGLSAAIAALLAAAGLGISNAADTSGYLQTPVPQGEDAKYGAIDGHRLWGWVEEQAKIARDYRDAGHPQFWGRIVGTSGDVADIEWLQAKFKQFGLSDVHAQPVNMFLPQWAPKSWSVTLVGGGKTMKLESAQPPYGSPATDGKELDLEVVYVGLGTARDFAGKNIKGKAVLSVSPGRAGGGDASKLAMEGGAAAILSYDLRGQNHKYQAYRAYTNVPTFNLGTADGNALRDIAGGHVKIRLDADWAPNQKTALVWGTLPGATDETVYIVGHRDGWFEASGDNASGIAVMLGLAEYYSKIPQAQRKRTIVFIGTDGHHQVRPGTFGESWLVANRDKFFSKTALMINVEHPAEVLTYGDFAGSTTTIIPNEWYAGGTSRPALTKLAHDAFNEFGVPIRAQPNPSEAPGGDMNVFRGFVPGVVAQSNDFAHFHTDVDSPDTVSWAGLEAVTRAYAKLIDGVNTMPLSALQRPAEPPPPTELAFHSGLDVSKCQAWIKDSSAMCTP